jgi:hypothetical protein
MILPYNIKTLTEPNFILFEGNPMGNAVNQVTIKYLIHRYEVYLLMDELTCKESYLLLLKE